MSPPRAQGRVDLARLMRFGVVGIGCAGLYAALAWSLNRFAAVPATLSSIAAYALAGLASYLGQKVFTFRSDAPHADAAPRFLAIFLAGVGVAAAAPLLFTDRLHLPPLVAIVFTCGVVPLINYTVMSRLVFARAPQTPAP